ncbi:hypothetical protein Tco_0013739 [Tanacetum coccineum]
MQSSSQAEAERLLGIANTLIEENDLTAARDFGLLAQETDSFSKRIRPRGEVVPPPGNFRPFPTCSGGLVLGKRLHPRYPDLVCRDDANVFAFLGWQHSEDSRCQPDPGWDHSSTKFVPIHLRLLCRPPEIVSSARQDDSLHSSAAETILVVV